MAFKKPTSAKQLLFGGVLLSAVLIIGCNNESKEAETPAPTPGVETKPATSTPPPPPPDTASIRPVKTPT